MREIILNHGKVALVDDEDYEWLNQWKWGGSKYRNTFYAIREGHDGKRVCMHRLILGLTRGSKLLADHKNLNGLDNQRHNLRTCDKRENQHNRGIDTTPKSSIYKGVSYQRKMRKWYACIMVNGKNSSLGYYFKEQDAAIAYNEAAIKYFGEFARPNVITREVKLIEEKE